MFAGFMCTVHLTFADTLTAACIISSHLITESSIVFVKYSTFLQLHEAELQI